MPISSVQVCLEDSPIRQAKYKKSDLGAKGRGGSFTKASVKASLPVMVFVCATPTFSSSGVTLYDWSFVSRCAIVKTMQEMEMSDLGQGWMGPG